MSWTGFMFGLCAVSIVAMIWRHYMFKGSIKDKIEYPGIYGKPSKEEIDQYAKVDKLFTLFATSAAISFVIFCASLHNWG